MNDITVLFSTLSDIENLTKNDPAKKFYTLYSPKAVKSKPCERIILNL